MVYKTRTRYNRLFNKVSREYSVNCNSTHVLPVSEPGADFVPSDELFIQVVLRRERSQGWQNTDTDIDIGNNQSRRFTHIPVAAPIECSWY